MDIDKDGKLNKNDIEQMVHSDTINMNKIDVQKMIDEADLDGDGKIDYNEFLVLLRERTRTFFKVKWFPLLNTCFIYDVAILCYLLFHWVKLSTIL